MLRGLKFPNGICIASDGQSILFAETFGCCIRRYWFDGPKAGTIEMVIDNLPGYPDNINLASDGNYWLAMVGMRSPALDLAWKMPGFRKRMGKRVPIDEWLFPNINTGCVIKFNERGEVLELFWDLRGENHPMITSMREHRGHLYLGGIMNNRIGRYKLSNADPNFVQYDRRWGQEQMIAALRSLPTSLLGRGDATITVPSFDGALKPNQILERAETLAQFDAPEDLATDGKALYLADGAAIRRFDGSALPEVRRFDRTITALCCLPDGGIAVALDGREVPGRSRRRSATAAVAAFSDAVDALRSTRCRRPCRNAASRPTARVRAVTGNGCTT